MKNVHRSARRSFLRCLSHSFKVLCTYTILYRCNTQLHSVYLSFSLFYICLTLHASRCSSWVNLSASESVSDDDVVFSLSCALWEPNVFTTCTPPSCDIVLWTSFKRVTLKSLLEQTSSIAWQKMKLNDSCHVVSCRHAKFLSARWHCDKSQSEGDKTNRCLQLKLLSRTRRRGKLRVRLLLVPVVANTQPRAACGGLWNCSLGTADIQCQTRMSKCGFKKWTVIEAEQPHGSCSSFTKLTKYTHVKFVSLCVLKVYGKICWK